jgi:hypothetical protein
MIFALPQQTKHFYVFPMYFKRKYWFNYFIINNLCPIFFYFKNAPEKPEEEGTQIELVFLKKSLRDGIMVEYNKTDAFIKSQGATLLSKAFRVTLKGWNMNNLPIPNRDKLGATHGLRHPNDLRTLTGSNSLMLSLPIDVQPLQGCKTAFVCDPG